MTGFKDLMLIFSIYFFLGWAIETVYVSTIEKKIINRGFLTGFFCPIYGFGSILIIGTAKWIEDFFRYTYSALLFNVLVAVVLVTALEYITGYILEKIFNYKWWDYSNEPYNLHGYICLKYSLFWGGLAFLLIHVIHPVILDIVDSIPNAGKSYLAILLLVYFVADTTKTVVETLDLRKVILNASTISAKKYYEKIIRYKRFFLAFPRLLKLNAGMLNCDIRSILNDRMDKIKVELKSRFLG